MNTVLRCLLLLAVPLALAGCASTQSGELIDFDPEQAYSFSGTLGGEILTGVVQFTGYHYRMYSSTGMCNGERRAFRPDRAANTPIDLRCGSLMLRLWLVDGQLSTEGTASLSRRVREDGTYLGNATEPVRLGYATYTSRIQIAQQ